MHSHHTRTMAENGEDAVSAPAPVPPTGVDPTRIVGMGTNPERNNGGDDAASIGTAATARIALARDTSVRVAKDVTQSVGKTVGDTVKTIDEKFALGEKLNEVTASVTTKTTDATAKIQPKIQGTRESLMVAAKGVGESVRNLDDKLKVSQRVGEVVKRSAAVDRANGAAGAASVGAKTAGTTPAAILRSEGTMAQTLSVSDQHVTILLTHTVPGDAKENTQAEDISIDYRGEEDEEKDDEYKQQLPKTVKSLLKLTVVPFHRHAFDHTLPNAPGSEPNAANVAGAYTSFSALNESDEHNSRDILAFLSDYSFDLTSESGAEYSYWKATPDGGRFRFIGAAGQIITKPIASVGNLLGRLGGSKNKSEGEGGGDNAASAAPSETSAKPVVRTKAGSFTVELISPASDRQIQRAIPSPSVVLIEETPELYEAITKPHIAAIVEGGSLSWINNIVDGTKESERLLYDHEQYIVNIDTKWRLHPDPNAVPREEWLHHPSTADLYCLGIFKANDVACLRDLRAEHLPALESMVTNGIVAIERTYGVPRDQIRCFVHYLPQFYPFHVHFTRLQNEIGCQVERGHLVSDIIQNLKMDPLYYTKRTVTYKLGVTDELYGKIAQYQQGDALSDVGV